MPQFAEQLIAARKAKSMTQEQLAQAVHISRSRVSRWETGGAVPDLEMILKLCQVLECDFLPHMESMPPELVTEAGQEDNMSVMEETQEDSSGEPEAPAEDKPASRKRWPQVALVAVVLVALVLILLPGKKTPAPAEVYEPYTKAWYQQDDALVENQAYVTITPKENPTRAIYFEGFEGGVGWFYEFCCEETNGVDFTITKIIQTVFNAVGTDDFVCEGDDLAAIEMAVTLYKGMPQPLAWTGGFPLQNVSGVGLAVEGVDANGNELTFRGYVEFSPEIAE